MSFSLRYYGAYNTQYYCLLLFLLLNVFLALLGTFWFRTRQRRQEIAIQMAMGSSRRQVFVRLISEALLLLLFATFPAMLIDYLWVHAKAITSYYGGFVAFPRTVSRYFIAVGVAFLIIAGTIVLGILYPAYKATKVPPADALQEE